MPAVTERPRSLHQRNRPPAWSDTPNANTPPEGTVGPNVAIGGEVMHAQAWSGWPEEWATPWMEPGSDLWSGFGFGRMSPDGYLKRVSTVMTCVDLNTRQLASFPVYAVRGTQLVPSRSWMLNPEPMLYGGGWGEFMKAATNSLQLTGEAIVWATAWFADGFPSRFVAVDPHRVEVVDRYSDDVPADYAWSGSTAYRLDRTRWLDPSEVCHIRYQKLAGKLRGVGPLEWLGRNLVSADALEKYSTNLAKHGVWSLLKNPANLNATQREDAKRAWMNARAGNPAAPAVVSGGWEFEALSLNPTDMALLDLKVFDEQRIASAFGVPPFLIGLPQPGGMTYSNATSLYDAHWRQTLRPMAQTIADAMSLWALPHGTRLEFNRDEYVRPALGERAVAYQTLFNMQDDQGRRAITVDEIRIAERYPPYNVAPEPDATYETTPPATAIGVLP